MRVYFESSAFAKRYVQEAGTPQVLDWCERASELALSVIVVPELMAAFRRLLREGRLDEAQYQQLKGDLMADIADALICDTSRQVVQKAIDVIETCPLRGMDAIHIGAALACSAEAFVSANARQCHAARQLGLQVIEVAGT